VSVSHGYGQTIQQLTVVIAWQVAANIGEDRDPHRYV
jgi:hypothetical protein